MSTITSKPRALINIHLVLIFACIGSSLLLYVNGASSTHKYKPPSDSASTPTDETTSHLSGFFSAAIAAIAMIVASELGDKTFFIAALLAMRHGRQQVFIGVMLAMIVMTVLSAALGMITQFLPRSYTHWFAIGLFLFFGVRLLRDAYYMTGDEALQELEEAEQELAEKDSEHEDVELIDRSGDLEAGADESKRPKSKWHSLTLGVVSPILVQALTLTFVAEWGDRSQIATIVMAAELNTLGVIIGGIIGHSICTVIAVTGGEMLATRISERHVTLVGGVLFLIFAVHAMIVGEDA